MWAKVCGKDITLTVSVKLAAATGILMAKLNLQDIKIPLYDDILSSVIVQVSLSRHLLDRMNFCLGEVSHHFSSLCMGGLKSSSS